MSYHEFLLFSGLAIVMAFWLPRFLSGPTSARAAAEQAEMVKDPLAVGQAGRARDQAFKLGMQRMAGAQQLGA